MKTVAALLRFLLLIVCSFFVALALFVLAACRNGNGRTKSAGSSATDKTGQAVPDAARVAEAEVDGLLRRLDSDDPHERQAAEKALISMGQRAVTKLTDALKTGGPEVRARAINILSELGWYVTRDGRVEKKSESKEFQDMMRKRLPELPAE